MKQLMMENEIACLTDSLLYSSVSLNFQAIVNISPPSHFINNRENFIFNNKAIIHTKDKATYLVQLPEVRAGRWGSVQYAALVRRNQKLVAQVSHLVACSRDDAAHQKIHVHKLAVVWDARSECTQEDMKRDLLLPVAFWDETPISIKKIFKIVNVLGDIK